MKCQPSSNDNDSRSNTVTSPPHFITSLEIRARGMLSLNFLKRVSGDGSVRSARFCDFCGALGVGRGLRRRVDLHAHRHPRAHHSRGMHTQLALLRKRAGLKLLALSLSRARARLHCKKLYSHLNCILFCVFAFTCAQPSIL